VHIFGGEFHPFRLAVPSLYKDVFQKIKAAGFNAVSFYTYWALHEPKRGAGVNLEGVMDLRPFIETAQEAGLWLIARPGPYM
jgi:beta-galactosidase GanA